MPEKDQNPVMLVLRAGGCQRRVENPENEQSCRAGGCQ